ncbi:ribulose-phosphate 3-epimerase [Mycoplasmopsis agalactiae]|uniref:ribulose-phosphate 3-epimerase n=1 Tax=Mycoplasmopsis agalactiae TaxID=2110 RepID=UPI001455E531|nr:ribulose-phosphate 3-epimerase [Mycoplasmopsis agalactiae]MCE6056999.1 ribulose-phosphate 3-epimerase [Mycoplasmopsis agalactiae]MCE6078786.1 ribulose-phosphate 3-epimerase [Mycoplasmopsis agalactiae]MCE6095169.1 ribulose-phosphate 3-epimerase [Mycoplasmopsis agalactiae]MCE6114424.1 ribulose-phosphate 3-epimerase [Mycoplasmopsis agalactiae]NLS34259.1 ribulose-phosphate 3-epimerase [Mycoplasmopsis agalactiae]
MNKNNNYVTPSLLNVEPENRLNMANILVNEGIKWIHYDVMDGKFVPNLAIELDEIKNIHEKGLKHFKDAHLMVENPLDYIDLYKDVVDIVTFHYEAVESEKLLKFLKQKHHDYRLGIAIKPSTEVEEIKKFLPYIQLVLVMSVEPGKGGQKFIPSAIDKIKLLKQLRIKHAYDYLIQVDGGINDVTGPECFKAGADACVAGTFIVSNPTKARINSILGIK